MRTAAFRKMILDHHAKHGRHDLPWRKTHDPYRILVSEIMLQQTQVARVLSKYEEFLAAFPTIRDLAAAPTSSLLSVWKGLGYNRRALNLRRAAQEIVTNHGGEFPRGAAQLEALPGIGQSTRGALLAFAFNIATPFIETNIRAVYIHCFFADKKQKPVPTKSDITEKSGVTDKELLPLIEKTLDTSNPRVWYYALMDYGVHLKSRVPNPSRRSAHHARQSPFKGSNRELRSNLLGFVMKGPQRESRIIGHFVALGKDEAAIRKNLRDLEKEGFVSNKRNIISIT